MSFEISQISLYFKNKYRVVGKYHLQYNGYRVYNAYFI